MEKKTFTIKILLQDGFGFEFLYLSDEEMDRFLKYSEEELEEQALKCTSDEFMLGDAGFCGGDFGSGCNYMEIEVYDESDNKIWAYETEDFDKLDNLIKDTDDVVSSFTNPENAQRLLDRKEKERDFFKPGKYLLWLNLTEKNRCFTIPIEDTAFDPKKLFFVPNYAVRNCPVQGKNTSVIYNLVYNEELVTEEIEDFCDDNEDCYDFMKGEKFFLLEKKADGTWVNLKENNTGNNNANNNNSIQNNNIQSNMGNQSNTCSRCGAELKPGAKFCTKCGQPVGAPQMKSESVATCSKCGAVLKPGAKFCTKCGTPVGVAQADNKGFLQNVGAGIHSAVTGGSFIEGYAEQDQRSNEFYSLRRNAYAQIKKAQDTLKELEKKYDVSATDSIEVDEILESIKNAIEDPKAVYGDKNSTIRNGLKKLEEKIYAIKVSVDPEIQSQREQAPRNSDDGATATRRNNPVIELHTVNPDECVVVRNKVTWGIQPGQIARRITERELDSIDGIKGFIISEGCSAMIFVNGSLVDIFEAGAYSIPQKNEQYLKNEFDRLLDEMTKQDKEKREKEKREEKPKTFVEQGGVAGLIGRGIRHVGEFFFGATPERKKQEKNKEAERMKRLKSEVEKALQKKNPTPVLSVILVSNRFIRLTFGGTASEYGIDYQPYKIPIKMFDVNVGVSLTVKVTDIRPFVTNYLTDRNSFTTCDLFNLLTMRIEDELKMCLRNENYETTGLTNFQIENTKRRILSLLNDQILKDAGLECIRIEQITDHNEDFERFRSVERELYFSEKEIDYLQRTGEIRNKLEQETNRQKINSCHNEEDLLRAMQEIDKERLLREDEMAEFILKLDFQRKIREAKTDEEMFEALSDIKAKHLLKEEEMAILEDELLKHKIDRDSITEVMRIHTEENLSRERMQSEWALSDARQDHEWEREDIARKRGYGIEDEERNRRFQQEEAELQHQGVTTAASLDIKRQLDAYEDERDEKLWDRDWIRNDRSWNRDFERQQLQRKADWELELQKREQERIDEETAYNRGRQDKFDDSTILNQNADAAVERLRKIQESERLTEAQRQAHVENIHAMDTDVEKTRINAEATMTADQLVGKNIANMDAAAQAKFAESLGSGKENELLRQQQEHDRELYEKMMQMQQQNGQMSQQQMMEMLKMTMGTVTAMSANNAAAQQGQFNQQMQFQNQRLEDQVQMKNEYRENMQHQQARVEHAQDTALNSMANVGAAAASNLSTANVNVHTTSATQQQQPQAAGKTCPKCGSPVEDDDFICGECGYKLK